MNSISLLKLRSALGETIEEVRRSREPLVVLKNNKPVAVLSPYAEGPTKPTRAEVIEEVSRYRATLDPVWQVKDMNQDDISYLYDLAGWGEHVELNDEKDKISRRVAEKHGR